MFFIVGKFGLFSPEKSGKSDESDFEELPGFCLRERFVSFKR